MKKFNYYFTLLLVAFITLFSFFNMFQIVSLSNNVIKIIINNLLPSLLPTIYDPYFTLFIFRVIKSL